MEKARGIFPAGTSVRWLTANCYQIKLSSGKVVVFDPFLPGEDDANVGWRKYACGIKASDIERADFAIIGHPHGDHIGSLTELFDKTGCRVLGHSAWAFYLSRDLLIPQQMVFPYEFNSFYQFDGFSLETFVARHSPGDVKTRGPLRQPDPGTVFETLNLYGAMFNCNFILTDINNVKIFFCAGVHEDVELNAVKGKGVNIMLYQVGRMEGPEEVVEASARKAVKCIKNCGAEITMPTHHEKVAPEVVEAFCSRVNEMLVAEGCPGRMFSPRRCSWYSVGTCIELKED